ncbi:hypothetical protein [Paenirhodobacter populi]|uniref:hypothetical protein n=1 Tax=Paenirhodobacter populi TaxID=2306993 RepID=UPI0013E2C90B|nr:hypothetical protein [Sinirhodobacter populi]
MPAPDPFGLSYDETPDGMPMVSAEVWNIPGQPQGNRRHRIARAKAVLMKLRQNDWTCPQCGGLVPIWRRADAVYCSTGCRKRAMRGRKA